jgi:hypothetical protein
VKIVKNPNIDPRNPVISKAGRRSVGWPLYTVNNRYVLRIDDSAPKELESR